MEYIGKLRWQANSDNILQTLDRFRQFLRFASFSLHSYQCSREQQCMWPDWIKWNILMYTNGYIFTLSCTVKPCCRRKYRKIQINRLFCRLFSTAAHSKHIDFGLNCVFNDRKIEHLKTVRYFFFLSVVNQTKCLHHELEANISFGCKKKRDFLWSREMDVEFSCDKCKFNRMNMKTSCLMMRQKCRKWTESCKCAHAPAYKLWDVFFFQAWQKRDPNNK